ncbi:MAG: hypothetical protein AAGD92_12055 [Pseudomonadota bacterium]
MRFVVFAAALFLAACAATGPAEYGAANEKGFGYAEQRIEAGRYRITYRGSGGMPPELVEDYALRRAAELAVADGYDWFRVADRSLSGEERGGVSLGAGVGGGNVGRRSGVGVGVGGNFGRVGAQDFFTARLEVLMGVGERPDSGEVYDARSVLDNLAGPAPYRFESE